MARWRWGELISETYQHKQQNGVWAIIDSLELPTISRPVETDTQARFGVLPLQKFEKSCFKWQILTKFWHIISMHHGRDRGMPGDFYHDFIIWDLRFEMRKWIFPDTIQESALFKPIPPAAVNYYTYFSTYFDEIGVLMSYRKRKEEKKSASLAVLVVPSWKVLISWILTS